MGGISAVLFLSETRNERMAITSQNCKREIRSFTFVREHRLKEINFVFACDHDGGLFHKQWLEMFEELQKFYEKHGHYKVNHTRNPN